MELIRDAIKTVFDNLEKKKKAPRGDDPEGWIKKTLTKRELRHIKGNYFRKGVLGLGVDSSSWLYYFNLKKDKLLESLKKQSAQVKEIHLYLGEEK